MSTFIIGGSSSGKSLLAQRLARAQGQPLYYIATMIPRDAEDEARIARHRRDREGWGFQTIECGRDILSSLDNANPDGSFLLDSVTALLANEMFSSGGVCLDAGEKLAREMTAFVLRTPKAVIVSDWVFSDAAVYDELTEAYRAALGRIHRALAARCDNVIEAVAGIPNVHKGRWPL